MQIVIDVPDAIYEEVMSGDWSNFAPYGFCKAIENGTPLPKGHGRLIDADALVKKMEEREEKLKDDKSMWKTAGVETALDMFAPTIIEADTESENKESCDNCKHNTDSWDSDACDGCCGANSKWSGEIYPGEFEAMEHNGRLDALESEEISREEIAAILARESEDK